MTAPAGPRPTTWPAARVAVAAAAVGAALLTAVAAELLRGPEGWVRLPALALVAAAVGAALRPALVVAVPGVGALLGLAALVGTTGRSWWLLLLGAGAVATTELAALAGRLEVVAPRPPGPGLVEVGRHVALGVGATAAALAATLLAGAVGAPALVLGAGAAVALAVLVARPGPPSPDP